MFLNLVINLCLFQMPSSPRSVTSTSSAASPRPTGAGTSTGKDSSVRKDNAIICFEHCDHKIFSLNALPATCPVCTADLKNYEFPNLPPFKLPSPLARAQDHSCAVVIKPTHGDFLHDYVSGDNLHIAVTNSRGAVVEYDKSGVKRERTKEWNRCLVVDLALAADPDVVGDPDWAEYWDWRMEAVVASKVFTAEDYDESEHNCFAFVLALLASLRQVKLYYKRVGLCLFLHAVKPREKFVLSEFV